MSVIAMEALTKYYGSNRGIDGVTLDVREGEIFGFIGPNGAGKSTTIRTLLGFIRPSSGAARIFGKDCAEKSAEIRSEVGYLPSEVNYYDGMKVGELLKYSARFYTGEKTRDINELCSFFDLDIDRYVNDLSLGNRKKVGIVQALLHKPKLLILDEPTSGLDPLIQNKFFEILAEEKAKGTTIFFSSHVLSEVQRMCDRVAIIREGKILKVESMESIRTASYKKVRLDFARDVKNLSEIVDSMKTDKATNISIDGYRVQFLYKGQARKLLEALSALPVKDLWVEEPSLEEIFMHYYEKEAV